VDAGADRQGEFWHSRLRSGPTKDSTAGNKKRVEYWNTARGSGIFEAVGVLTYTKPGWGFQDEKRGGVAEATRPRTKERDVFFNLEGKQVFEKEARSNV